jgi:hypothetical protein
VGNGTGLSINHIGSAHLSWPNRSFILKNLLHVPSICKILLSVSKFAHDNSVFLEFHSSFFVIKHCRTRPILHQGPLKHSLYQMLPSLTSTPSPYSLVVEMTSPEQWHKRLGHPTLRTVKQVISKFSLPVFPNKPDASCASCQQAKAHQLPFPASTSVFNHPLQLLFSDVWGLSPVISSNGNKYYVTFIDAFSRFTWLFPIQCKSDVFSVFNKFLLMVNVYSILKFFKFKLIGVGNFVLSTHSFINLASSIVCHVLTHINSKVVSNENIAILSTQLLHCLLKVMFPKDSGMRLAKHRVI